MHKLRERGLQVVPQRTVSHSKFDGSVLRRSPHADQADDVELTSGEAISFVQESDRDVLSVLPAARIDEDDDRRYGMEDVPGVTEDAKD